MAVTRGQKSTLAQVGSGAGVTTTWSTNPTAGNTILVFVQCVVSPTSVTDNGTTPATFTLDVTNTNLDGAYLYRANNITLPSAGSYAVTVSGPTGHTYQAYGIEYAGVKSGAPDATNSGHASGTSVSSGAVTPAASGGLVFGGFSDDSGLNPETITFTGTSPLTEQARNTNGASYSCMAVADALTSSSQSLTWTLGDSTAWATVVAAYSPATGGGGGGGGGTGTNPSWDPSGAWTSIFDDEFTGTTLNPVWQPGWFGASGVTPGVNSGSPQNNSANVSVSGGFLNLKLGAVGGTVYGALVSTNPNNSATATGFQTGPPAAFEARIFVPGPDGAISVPNWVAWWTDGQSWPANGEIDILESLGTPDWNAAHVHDNATDGAGGTGAPGITHNLSPPYGWHTFGCYWKTPASNTVEFFYDGASIGSLSTDGFTSPQYLILVNTFNNAADITPTTMQVDWVRVWTPGAAPTVPGTPTGLAVTSVTSSSVSLSWNAASGTVTGYHVYQGGSLVATQPGTSYTATGLTAATTYTFTVDAYNTNGNSSQANPVSATTGRAGSSGSSGVAPQGQGATARQNWPTLILEGGFIATIPVQATGTLLLDDTANGKLDTNTLGSDDAWSDLTAWLRSANVNRPASRQQGPVYSYQPGTMSVVLNNKDGRFDPDNLTGPYVAAGVTELTAMVPVRLRAVWNGVTYPLFAGFTDSWDDDGQNYAGHYAETTMAATDAQKVLAGLHLDTTGAVGAGDTTGARIDRILTAAGWYTGSGKRSLATGNSTVQATTLGDTPWNLMQLTADSELGELYVNGAGSLIFRNRHATLEDTRSNTSQGAFSDQAATGLAYRSVTRARDDTTIANDIQATRTTPDSSAVMQEAFDQASITKFLFMRTYQRTDLILQDDATTLQWAQWVLYIAKNDEDRFDQIVIHPLRDPANLWPQVLGREVGDRITVVRNPPGVGSAVTRDCFIRGIQHAFDASAGTWVTTWTLQDASRYGSFLVLGNATLGQLDANALTFLYLTTLTITARGRETEPGSLKRRSRAHPHLDPRSGPRLVRR